MDYPYFLPILGKQTVEAGFDIPYPADIVVINFFARQTILIEGSLSSLGFLRVSKKNRKIFKSIAHSSVP